MPPLETPVPATGLFTVSWLLIAIPAVSAAILLLVGRRADRWAPYLGAIAPLISFALGSGLLRPDAWPRRCRPCGVSTAVQLDLQWTVGHQCRAARSTSSPSFSCC